MVDITIQPVFEHSLCDHVRVILTLASLYPLDQTQPLVSVSNVASIMCKTLTSGLRDNRITQHEMPVVNLV